MMKLLLVSDVLSRVSSIRDMRHDYEAAHAHEDQLHQTVLLAIALKRCPDPIGCAEAALETQKIEFPRHCA